MSRTENTKKNIFWGLLQKLIGILLPFATRTVLIYTMGMEFVGMGSLFQSVLQVLSLAELGVGSAMVFSMYKPMAEGDDDKICALLNLYKKCYLVIGGIILVVSLALIPFLDLLISGTPPEGVNIYILFGIYVLNNVSGYFLFAYKGSLFRADQRVDIIDKITLVFNIVTNVAQIALLYLFKNFYVYIAVLPVVTIATNIAHAVFANKRYAKYKPKGKLNKIEIKSIRQKVGGIIFQKIGIVVLNSADAIVISACLGLAVLGIYNGYFFVASAVMNILGILQTSLIPSVGNSIVKESKEKNYKDFNKFNFLYMWIVSWCVVCLVCLYQPFIALWQGEQNMLGLDIVILFAVYFFSYKMGDMCYVYKEAIGLWWQGKFVPLISSLINLVLNIILVKYIGLQGVLISTIVSAALINTPFGSYVLFKHYYNSRKRWVFFLLNTALTFVKCAAAGVATYFLCTLITGELWLVLLLRGLICIVLPNLILIVLNIGNPQLKNAFNVVKSVFRRKRAKSKE